MRKVIWLQTAAVFWLGGGTISPSYWLHLGLVIYADRNTYIRTTCAFEIEMAVEKSKDTSHQVLIKSQKNWLRKGVEQFALRSINLLLLFGTKRHCLRSGRSRSLFLSTRRAIKQTVVMIVAYHLCQLRAKFYPTSCCQVQLHMQRKLLGIISLDFDATGQLLFICSVFVEYLWRNGNTLNRASYLCRFQENLWFILEGGLV